MQYGLTITPAINPVVRHKIEDLLKSLGYEVTGGGTMTDMSECDISFNDNLNIKERGESRSSASK